MGIMDRIKKATGAEEQYDDIYDNEYYDGFEQYGDDEGAAPAQDMNNMGQQNFTNSGGIGGSSYQPSSQNFSNASGFSLSGNAIEMKVVKPERFESATQIATHLLEKRTIFLNLENTNKETARRLIDFLSGVAFSIDGSLKKIASNAYVIAPSNVDVGDAQLRSRPAKAAKEEEAPAEEPVDDNTKTFTEL